MIYKHSNGNGERKRESCTVDEEMRGGPCWDDFKDRYS